MNTLVNLQIERENGDWDADINAYAAQLGGEVHGNKIYAPSPGCAADDRSLVVIFNSATNFFIYGYDGSAGAAYPHVNKVISLKDNRRPEAERIAEANRIWSQTVSAQGTIVEKYLRSRAITLPVPEVIRFHRSLYHSKSYGIRPAMVARMDDVDGRLVA